MQFAFLAAVMLWGAEAPGAVEFAKTHGGPGRDRGVFVTCTRDGGYVVVGVTKSAADGDEDVYLVKTDAAGDELWSRTYGGAGDDNGWTVRELADGYAIAGFTKSLGAGGFDFYLVRTDPEGEVAWSQTYGGGGDDRCWALACCADGGFVLAGETTSSGAGGRDVLLVRTDALGNELWSQTYGGEKDDRCFAVVPAGDGGFVLAGQTFSQGAGDRDAHVIKTDAEGAPQWSRTFGGAASDVAHGITTTSDGGYLVTGYTTSLAEVDDDPYLIKLDAQGQTQWTRVLAMDGVNHTITGEQAADGGFFLVGFTEHAARRTKSALVVKTTPEGELDWHEHVRPRASTGSMGYTVRATRDGGCVFTGHVEKSGPTGFDVLLVKIGGEGR